MPPPEIPLELLLMIAHHIREDHGELRYGDFNSFVQVNRALYSCLNRMLWKEAVENEVSTQRVLTRLINTDNLKGLSFFLEQPDVNFEVRLPAFGFATPLLLAAEMDDVPLACLLLEKGAKVEYFDPDNGNGKFSPLHAARSAEMVQLLLDCNADPEFEDDWEHRPLLHYAIHGHIAAMRMILQHGVDVNPIGDPFFEKSLHEAVIMGRLDSDENTPLHVAAEEGMTNVVKFLVERWPEGKEALNNKGQTPLSRFEDSRCNHQLSDEENQQIIALLGGLYSEANSD
jgi:hypothetical protein